MSTKSKTDTDFEDEILTLGASRAKATFRRPLANFYEYYLSGPVLGAEEYIEWFDTIRHASDMDEVKIYINSVGGNVDTALQFLRVLAETDAHVTASVEGSCMSAATMIFLAADSFEVTPDSLFMFHNYSGGQFGKGGELYDQAIFERTWSTNLLNRVYKGFLTQEEIQALLDNKDLWLHSEDVAERCSKLLAERTKHVESLQDAED